MDTEGAQEFLEQDNFAQLAGVEIVSAGVGYCKVKLHIEKKHLNGANVVMGGAIFTLADFAFAVASNSHGELALAINGNISFLKGKSEGVLYAEAVEMVDPKKLGVYDVKVLDEAGDIVALFTGMVYRKHKSFSST